MLGIPKWLSVVTPATSTGDQAAHEVGHGASDQTKANGHAETGQQAVIEKCIMSKSLEEVCPLPLDHHFNQHPAISSAMQDPSRHRRDPGKSPFPWSPASGQQDTSTAPAAGFLHCGVGRLSQPHPAPSKRPVHDTTFSWERVWNSWCR